MQQPRQDGKAASMLLTLDQYSRQRVPLYTGHRPTALSNLTVEEPAHGPTLQTTQVTTTMIVCKWGNEADIPSIGCHSDAAEGT